MANLRRAQRILESIGHRADSWLNQSLGYGTASDSTTRWQFREPPPLSAPAVEAYYVGDSLAHRIVTAIVDDATRQGWQLTSESNPQVAEDLHRYCSDRWDYTALIMQWCKEARLYGGVGIFVRADDGTEWTDGTPLRRSAVKKIAGFELLRPIDLQTQSVDQDVLSTTFGMPDRYRFSIRHPHGISYTASDIHRSRVIRIDHGIKLNERLRRNLNHGFSESVLLPVLDEITRYRAAFASIDSLFSNMSQPVYKVRDLLRILSTQDGGDVLRARFNQIEQIRSSMNAILLDSEGEDFSRVATPLSEIANVIDRYMLGISQAAAMPMTRLFGMSPAGLNATGDADIRQWYDSVQAYRELKVESVLKTLLRYISADPDAPSIPDDLEINWPSLWQQSPAELADTRAKIAQSDTAYVGAGVYSAEEIALARSQPDGWALDVKIDEREFDETIGIQGATGAEALENGDTEGRGAARETGGGVRPEDAGAG